MNTQIIENRLQKMVTLDKSQTISDLLDNGVYDFINEIKKIMAHYVGYDFLFNVNNEIVDEYELKYDIYDSEIIFKPLVEDLPKFEYQFRTDLLQGDIEKIVDNIESEIKEYHTCNFTKELICHCDCDEHYLNFKEAV